MQSLASNGHGNVAAHIKDGASPVRKPLNTVFSTMPTTIFEVGNRHAYLASLWIRL